MSKQFSLFSPLAALLFILLAAGAKANSQDIEAVITVDPASPTSANVQGYFSTKITSRQLRNFAVLRENYGIANLGERLGSLLLEDSAGRVVAYRQMVPGEIVAEAGYAAWQYTMDLSPPRSRSAAAHVSWLTPEGGLLYLDDILPIPPMAGPVSARIRLVLPTAWKVGHGEIAVETTDISKTVIFTAKNLKEQRVVVDGATISVAAAGVWKFTDQELADYVREIYSEYRRLFGSDATTSISLNLLSFPGGAEPGMWAADTRGSTVTIVSSDTPFRTQSLQRLHEQLRHEIFHLWLPNGVTFSGKYDWFYEGFALYQSLRTGVALNRLRFDDFLDTIGRAYTIDSIGTDRRSLLDASSSRQTGSDTQLYARGLMVAFLADLSILKKTGGRDDVSAILRSVFTKHRRPAPPSDANAFLLGIPELRDLSQYISGGARIDWRDDLALVGIEATEHNSFTKLKVVSKPNGRQRKMLDRLGYNNWRKLSVTR